MQSTIRISKIGIGLLFFILLGVAVFMNIGDFSDKKGSDVKSGIQTFKDLSKISMGADDYLNNPENIKDPDFILAKKSLINGDINTSIDLWEKVVKRDTQTGKLKTDVSQKPGNNSKTILAHVYLNYGNYYYKEQEYAEKARKLLMENGDDTSAEGIRLIGYSYEITKNYTDALVWYEKGRVLISHDDIFESIFMNQIGHVYDLKGDLSKAYEYYSGSYKLDDKNYAAAANIARYLVRTGKLQESLPYFELALKVSDMKLRSEVYFSLSSVELELGGLKPNIEKSISYAKSSIIAFQDFPMGYLALARGLYMKNDKKYYKEIEENITKSIALNPNGYYAYELRAMNEIDRSDYEKSIVYFTQAIENTKVDMILMDNERESIDLELQNNGLLAMLIGKYRRDGKASISELSTQLSEFPYTNSFIKRQLKRNNSGIFSSFSGIKEFSLKFK